MFGQGRPLNTTCKGLPPRARLLLRASWVVLYCASLIPGSASAQNELAGNHSMRLRLSWGGGSEKTWHATIRPENCALSDPIPLGLSLDTPGSAYLADGRIEVRQPTATNYGGVDFQIVGRFDSRLSVEIAPAENPELRVVRTIQLQSLKSQPVTSQLDSEQNQFTLVRAPGDSLPVDIGREHLVFDPGESWRMKITPNLCNTSLKTARCAVRLVAARTNSPVLETKSWDITLDEYGSSVPIEWDWKVPAHEAVYDLIFEIEPRRYQQASFTATKISRRVQFVVLGREPQTNSTAVEPILARNHEIGQIDASQAIKWDRRLALPGRSGMPAFLRNGNANATKAVDSAGQRMLRLEPGQWQTFSLPTKDAGARHRVEIDFGDTADVALGFSVLTVDPSGKVPLFGTDSGVTRNAAQAMLSPPKADSIQHHTFYFWPGQSQPLLLVMNRHATAAATIGKIRVFEDNQKIVSPQTATDSTSKRRGVLAFYEYPLFAENFGSDLVMDVESDQSLTDWLTFYQGAKRMIEHLRDNHYRGLVLSVASDGGGLYPSSLLQPTARYDSGRFFASGQDPVRKDVLELLSRMCSREGLELVPAVSFNGRLPGVEDQLRLDPSCGALQVDYRKLPFPSSANLARYNSMSTVVQNEIQRIVSELAERYGQHSSWGGVSLICRGDTCTILSGRRASFDTVAIDQFYAEQQLTPPATPVEYFGDAVHQVVLGTHRDQWIAFRCRKMGEWYQALEQTIRSKSSTGKLYLSGVDLYRLGELPSLLSPSLQHPVDFKGAMRELGWDLDQLQKRDNTVLLRSNRLAPTSSLASQRVDINLANLKQFQETFAANNQPADFFIHRASWANVDNPDQNAAKNDPSLASISRWQPLTPLGLLDRQRFAESLARSDTRLFVDGGWLLPLGGSASNFSRILNNLPDVPFETVKVSRATQVQPPVVVRQLNHNGVWYSYIVNASPWPGQVKLRLNGTPDSRLTDVGGGAFFGSSGADDPTTIEVKIAPFELRAVTSVHSQLQIVDYTFSVGEEQIESLRSKLRRLQGKLVLAAEAKPLDVLHNPDFNDLAEASFGWRYDTKQVDAIQNRRDVKQENNWALNLKSKGETVWIRSNEFPIPVTGRLSISVWLRVDDATQPQPPLRIAIEATSEEGEYYRFARVGILSQGNTGDLLESNWKQFVVHFDDLPIQAAETVRIGFDLMGSGDVWIDRAEVYDRWFDGNDTKALTQLLATAGSLLQDPATWDECRRMLDGYWPQFLDQSVNPQPTATATPEGSSASEIETQASDRNPFSLRRIRRTEKPSLFPFR